MGRSSETFSKKENEKKRLKKQQEKKERAEERKSNAVKGQSLENMMAYVDENGNITSTPPDPTKKKKISTDDIRIGTPKQEDIPVEIERTGTLTFFNEGKGYGFIRDAQSQESVFVHINGIIQQIKEGDKVTFETEKGPKGLNAIKVKKAAK
ncbi:cold-shock protein [Mucilaginibacter terrae]|uniref:Cold shock CspA family protein n=1 Tax=Mucilaginibacter terrae TaxID=1955052 RepID=A0ABU3GW42_9SPHI|nr:cold shock domain-containing protein [Mucilaginibacter terrae]MDT3403988.1 cold shock CspA family protein [Mucilaginibacter terrae]